MFKVSNKDPETSRSGDFIANFEQVSQIEINLLIADWVTLSTVVSLLLCCSEIDKNRTNKN